MRPRAVLRFVEFQSLIGRLKTELRCDRLQHAAEFQSLIGRLKTEPADPQSQWLGGFQSLIGRLKTAAQLRCATAHP